MSAHLIDLTADQLDEIVERTEYARGAVPIGDAAAADYRLREEALRELGRRQGHDPR